MSTKLVVCPKCGAENATIDKKCMSCKASLKGAEARIVNHHLKSVFNLKNQYRWRFIVPSVLAVLMAAGIIYANANTQTYDGSNTGAAQQPSASVPPAKAQPTSSTPATLAKPPVVNSTNSSSSAASRQAITYAQNCISQGQAAVQEENNYLNTYLPPVQSEHDQALQNLQTDYQRMLTADPSDGSSITATYNNNVAQEDTSYETLSQNVRNNALSLYQTYMGSCN